MQLESPAIQTRAEGDGWPGCRAVGRESNRVFLEQVVLAEPACVLFVCISVAHLSVAAKKNKGAPLAIKNRRSSVSA